jgi:hypothetical protein
VADNGTEIVCTDKKQPWDVKADEKDPTKFRYSISKDMGSQ